MTPEEFDKVVAPVRSLIVLKGQDYNSNVKLGDYFPFGAVSYVQMIHLKSTRLRSLIEQKGPPNFDSIKDTLQDLLAYTTFYLHFLEQEPKCAPEPEPEPKQGTWPSMQMPAARQAVQAAIHESYTEVVRK